MPLYLGNQMITPSIVTNGGSGGDEITATNKTSYAVTSGEKVWINGSDLVDFYEQGYSYNFNVVGSPTINNTTKVVGDFSESDYLQLYSPFNPSSSTWEVQIKFTTSSDITSEQELFQSCKGAGSSGRYGICLDFSPSGSKHFAFFCSADGSTWLFDLEGSYTILANTTYYVKFGWTGTTYYLDYSLDGEAFTRDITYNSSTPVYSSLINTYFGIYSTSTFQNPFTGSIDLSETKLIISGSDWWVPTVEKTNKIILNKDLTVVGSPTITWDFVVGGFSSGNYLTCSSGPIVGFDRSHSTWYFKFRPTSNVSYTCSIFEGFISLQHSSSNRLLSWNSNTSSSITISSSISKDTDYWIKVVIDGSNRTYYISTDGQNYTQAYSASDFGDQSGDGVRYSYIGFASWTSVFQGTVDLKGVYVQNSDNLTVWSATTKTIPWYINENTLTGIAKENIASGLTGTVETVLPE